MSIGGYFPPYDEVPDSAFEITPEIEKKLEQRLFKPLKYPDLVKTAEGLSSAVTGDNVNHPKHYTEHPSGVECIQVTEHMTFNCGNAVKYIWRNGLKDGNSNIQDLNKSIWYLQREIERLSKCTN